LCVWPAAFEHAIRNFGKKTSQCAHVVYPTKARLVQKTAKSRLHNALVYPRHSLNDSRLLSRPHFCPTVCNTREFVSRAHVHGSSRTTATKISEKRRNRFRLSNSRITYDFRVQWRILYFFVLCRAERKSFMYVTFPSRSYCTRKKVRNQKRTRRDRYYVRKPLYIFFFLVQFFYKNVRRRR